MPFNFGLTDVSSEMFQAAEEAIQVPSRSEIQINDPDDYLKRLNDLQSPRERLVELLISIFHPQEVPTHESCYIRYMALSGAIAGWIYGGPLRNQHMFEEYQRKFNAATYEGLTAARRHATDTYLYTVAGRGLKHLVLGGLLCGSAGVVAFSSITYRSYLYYPDWAIGFATLGALSRFWSLGVRGAVGGGAFGLIGGTLGFLVAKGYEFAEGMSVSEIRYLRHSQYLEYRTRKRERLQRHREGIGEETLKKYG